MGVIKTDSWRIIEYKIRRYPDIKREYDDYLEEIMSAAESTGIHSSEEYDKPQSVTEAKALKMNSAYMDRIKKEIEAVEFTYNSLKPEEQKVMRIRYWTNRKKNTPYEKMKACSYSERQMQRIVYKIIMIMAKYMGEIR